MTQTTAERFLILIQHPEKSTFCIANEYRDAGLIGSILLDLSLNKNIDINTDKIRVLSTSSNLPGAHKQVVERISNTAKTRKIKTWISIFSRHSRKYLKEMLQGMEIKGLIAIEHKKFLFIPYFRTRLINHKYRDEIIFEIRNAIFNGKALDDEKAAILGLVYACELHKVVCTDKKELKICRSKR